MKNPSFDLNVRYLDFDGRKIEIDYISSLCSDELIAYLVEGITNAKGKTLKDCLNNGDVKEELNKENYEYAMLTGCAIVKDIDKSKVYVLDTRHFPTRSIEEPDTEKSVRGSKDGFNENLLNCAGLIRRRIRTLDLVMEKVTVGKKNKLDICLCYLKSEIDQTMLKSIKERLNEIKNEDLIMTDRALEELIFDQSYNPFPLVRYSERPDVVSTHIHHGYLAIICDTSSSVMMLPTTLFEILEHVEEHRQTPIIGTFIRLIRFSAVFLSIYLVPLWMLIVNQGSVSLKKLFSIILVELAVELLRIATIHTPNSISNTILLFVSIGNVCGFATPNYELSLTNKYVKIFMILFSGLFGWLGFIAYQVILYMYLISLKPFGFSYLYPLIPFNGKDLLQFIIREPKK